MYGPTGKEYKEGDIDKTLREREKYTPYMKQLKDSAITDCLNASKVLHVNKIREYSNVEKCFEYIKNITDVTWSDNTIKLMNKWVDPDAYKNHLFDIKSKKRK